MTGCFESFEHVHAVGFNREVIFEGTIVDRDHTAAGAEAFRQTLRSRVWASPADSPALAGDPITRILVTEDASVTA